MTIHDLNAARTREQFAKSEERLAKIESVKLSSCQILRYAPDYTSCDL